jgi:hypothetical protein
MKCEYFVMYDWDEEPQPHVPCQNEAEFIACVPITNLKVCREHKCRCNRTVARDLAEKAPTPAHWMAL